MMMGAIAIFVKTPGLSPVKTRLAVKLGKKYAEKFYLASARAVADVVQTASQLDAIEGYYAVAEPSALEHSYWEDLPNVWQGEGGLGERMSHVYQELLNDHDFVILVGSDIPQMPTEELLSASAWLPHNEQARLVFGPSVDGGFWLFGGNCHVPETVWTDVTYSAADTGTQFLDKIQRLGDVRKVATLRDTDQQSDLLPLHQNLLELNEPLPAQRELIRVLEALPAHLS